MTPDTPAGGAVAWPSEAKRAGDCWQATTAICTHTMSEGQAWVWNACRAACFAVHNASPSTVSADAVLALAGKWRSEASKHDEDAQAARYYRQFKKAREIESIAFYKRRDADELEALTRGEGK